VIACLLLWLVWCPFDASAQKQQQLFTPVVGDKLFDATPIQTRLLEQIRSLPTTRSVQLVRINDSAFSSDALMLSLPQLPDRALLKTGGERGDSRNFTLTAAPKVERLGETTLVVRNGETTGSITSPRGLYRITPLGGGVHALVEVDSTKFPKDEPEGFGLRDSQRVQSRPPTMQSPAGRKADSAQTEITLLVAYTPATKAAVSDIDATIALAVLESNQAYQHSKVNIHLNLVDGFQTSYNEKGKKFEDILSDFVASSDVKTHRYHARADLAVLLIVQPDYCGLADTIMADASTAFAIVYYDCATGYYSLAHELGHLMGARHNEQVDNTPTPFAYGHGFLFKGPPSSWRTIMAYDCPMHCERLQYWANPRVRYGAVPMGTVMINDDSRVLNETAATVADFKNHLLP
jgi:hypothetical protein